MPRKKKVLILQQPAGVAKPIKVRLDARTIITLRSASAIAFWRTRYPNLTIL